MSSDRLQTEYLFAQGTKLKNADVVESTRHVTTLSDQVPVTIYFADTALFCFRKKVSNGSYFSRVHVSRGPR